VRARLYSHHVQRLDERRGRLSKDRRADLVELGFSFSPPVGAAARVHKPRPLIATAFDGVPVTPTRVGGPMSAGTEKIAEKVPSATNSANSGDRGGGDDDDDDDDDEALFYEIDDDDDDVDDDDDDDDDGDDDDDDDDGDDGKGTGRHSFVLGKRKAADGSSAS
jgi:hypothetical protein